MEMERTHHMAIDKEVLDQLLAGRDPQELFAKDGLIDELKKALSERMLTAELDDHLETEAEVSAGNRRNGTSQKTMLTGTSRVTLDIPRDRSGTFDPKLIARYQRRFPDFDTKIISMYARGMSVREIRGHLEELYGLDVSPDLISTVTDAVLETVSEWQGRPLDACYPLVFFDAIRVKIRDEGFVRNKAVYIALGILPDGTKEILGIWIEQTEGAKFWMRVMNELKNRGVADILIAVAGKFTQPAQAWPRRAQRLPRCDQCRVPGNGGPDLHCPSHQKQHELRLLEGPQGRRPVSAQRLSRRECRCRVDRAGGIRGKPLGPEISSYRAKLAPALGAGDPVLCVQRPDPADHLHHERDRGAELEAQAGGSHPRPLPR
jgi:putative transposase